MKTFAKILACVLCLAAVVAIVAKAVDVLCDRALENDELFDEDVA